MRKKLAFVAIGICAPCMAYTATLLFYAYGGYDGMHCAGLLDAIWICSAFEYYMNWLVNPLFIPILFAYFVISSVLTPIIWFLYKKRLSCRTN